MPTEEDPSALCNHCGHRRDAHEYVLGSECRECSCAAFRLPPEVPPKPKDSGRARSGLVRRLQRLVTEARAAGLVLVPDADAMGVRVLTREEYDTSADLRKVGELVSCDAACGGPSGSSESRW